MAALLGTLVVVQLLLPSEAMLPDGGVVPPVRIRAAAPPTLAGDPIIAQRALFSPGRRSDSVAGAAGSGASAPLGGAIAVGVLRSQGRTRVFLQAPDGSTRAVGAGGDYLGWRLVGIGSAVVEFARQGVVVRLTLGTSKAPVTPAPAEPKEEEDQQ